MRALRKQNGRPSAEASGTPVVSGKGGILAGDTPNLHLVLIRVQPSETAKRGRGLVRLLDDLTADLAPRTDRPIPVVAECPHRCGRYWNVAVDLRDADAPVVLRLPDNCAGCGASVDTYEMNRTLVASARHYVETFSRGRAS